MTLNNKIIRKFYFIRDKGGLSANENYNKEVHKMDQETYSRLSKCHSHSCGIMGGRMTLKEARYWDGIE